MLFWGIAGALALSILAAVLAPMLLGRLRTGTRSGYDMQVYRDQLAEVDNELARGVLTPGEAGASRAEISRRLIAAADADASRTGARHAPRSVTLASLALILLTGLGTGLVIYNSTGAPGLKDQPLAQRMQRTAEAWAGRPTQAEAEAVFDESGQERPVAELPPAEADLLERARTLLEKHPEDMLGHRAVASLLRMTGDFPAARDAQQQVVDILGNEAGASDLTLLAQLMILTLNGYVSPEAEALLVRALKLQPDNQQARYYSAQALLQGGRPDLALPILERILRESPPEAPWAAALAADINEIARQAGQPRRAAPVMPPGPDQQDIEAAGQMSQEDRTAMIEGMVAQLGERLATEGGSPGEWARLINSLAVLGRDDEARQVWNEAQSTFAGDTEAESLIAAAARNAGLTE